ncbi:MAG: hypothetical protein KAR14_03415 [Candidatus Aminicenantes bacterium]|nr:hypothetical protein [Candidatus Aminicenantes bacterium]
MSFCTAINCMDGRVQLPVIEYMKKKFTIDYVDMITEPGPNKILAEDSDDKLIESIFSRIEISVKKHGSKHIAIIGHFDCAGNPANQEEQWLHTLKAVKTVKERFKNTEVIGLWVNKNWDVTEIN